MGWFSKKPKEPPKLDPKLQEELEFKYGRAAFGAAIDLYMRTVKEDEKDASDLIFSLPDSRYRHLLFCLSTALKACALQVPAGVDAAAGALKSAAMFAVGEKEFRFFATETAVPEAYERGRAYLLRFNKQWEKIAALDNTGADPWPEQKRLLCVMLKAVESEEALTDADIKRMGPMVLYIDGLQPTLREAFQEFANEKRAASAPESGVVVGGLYAERNEDGTFGITKVLAADADTVHVRIYNNAFRAVPERIESSELSYEGMGETGEIGIGHAPIDKAGWLREPRILVQTESVREDELDGYREYLRRISGE